MTNKLANKLLDAIKIELVDSGRARNAQFQCKRAKQINPDVDLKRDLADKLKSNFRLLAKSGDDIINEILANAGLELLDDSHFLALAHFIIENESLFPSESN